MTSRLAPMHKLEERSDAGLARKNQLTNEPPQLTTLSQKAITNEAALSELTSFVATASKGGPFAPRDDVVVRLEMMREAMASDQAMLTAGRGKKKKRKAKSSD
eukprot:CAMPEP_0197423146 /NCGR_PEP_ID=MMETSP1170-20131217/19730_1 /TAXON_ID=54406 /ORGANISM="Sarcinochrysis sp, Strain CCMP770" /LENGTH=102 /DNA_ID=CAMNT_0042950545 /DNA_START=61 /DNA_END=369 /DNA_ORIENTATION=-